MNTKDNNRLIASIAVFSELCNSEGDLKSIISEFLKSVFAFEKQWALDPQEATQLLKKHFDFDIPEAVVRTCLNNLKNQGFLERKQGKFHVLDVNYNAEVFEQKLNQQKKNQSEIEQELIQFSEKLLEKKLDEQEKIKLLDNFMSYVLDNGVNEKYTTIISSFVIENAGNAKIVASLNQIKEGLVLVTGLRYTDDLNNLGSWDEELTIYLDTEHLFNASGYNGEVYEGLFKDFYELIKEINAVSSKKKQKKLVDLRYFTDTQEETSRFFYVAEKIIKREDSATPENTAMESICKGCTTVSDILRKKTAFESNLKTMGISLQADLDYYSKPELNIEDKELISKYKNDFYEDQVIKALKSFTRINYFKKGINRTSFEKCRHIILTGKITSLVLSKDLEVKNEAKDIPFATDIDFITNRVWFRLNKGLGKNNKLPATLDIVTKAQIALASQINRSVEQRFEELKLELKNGKLNENQAQDYYYNLREKAKRPEEIKVDILKESIQFIFENDLEKHLKEKSSLEQKAKQGELAIRKLSRIEAKVRRNKVRPYKILFKCIYLLGLLIGVIAIAGLSVVFWFLIRDIKTSNDTPIGVIGFVLALFLEIMGLVKYVKPFLNWLRRKCKRAYLKKIQNIGII